jgi:mRNA interferase YafQ
MLDIEYTNQFKKDLKLIKRRNKDLKRLEKAMLDIQHEKPLAQSLKDHALKGNWVHHRECHLEPDWLLIYRLFKEESVVVFVRTGSHSDLFQ